MSLSVANFDIQNASGQNVRLDIQAAFKALQGQSAESTDLNGSQCVAGMTFLNTTSKILKIRNSTNLGFTDIGNIDQPNLGLLSKTGGTMNGVLLLDDSNSATSPVLSFDGNTNLGLFRKSANIMGFSSSGTEQMVFDANGITLNDQNEIRFSETSSNGTNYISLKANSSVSSNRTITLPDETGTVITSASLLSQIGGQNLTNLHALLPASNNQYDLGSSSLRWANLYINDLNLSNEGHKNDVDGTYGSYTIQEGIEDLFLINRRNGKKFKFVLQEVS
tara:strand:- start:4026 stop:4859 length:834 start_codon:yes stop_codon:yes gene_type:complete